MPGFNADDFNDWEIFNMLMTGMATVRTYVRFRGVVYVDSMNDRRLTAPAQRILTWLTHFCGEGYMPNLTIVTTMWDGHDEEGIEDKLDIYETWRAGAHFQYFFSHGAKVYHHGLVKGGDGYRTLSREKKSAERKSDALQMIRDYGDTAPPLTLQIYDQIANGRTIETTSAGRWLRAGSNNPEGQSYRSTHMRMLL